LPSIKSFNDEERSFPLLAGTSQFLSVKAENSSKQWVMQATVQAPKLGY